MIRAAAYARYSATISATRVSMLSSEQYTNLLMKMDIR